MDTSASGMNFALRAYRGPEDHPAMNDVANTVRAFDGETFAYDLRTLPMGTVPAPDTGAAR